MMNGMMDGNGMMGGEMMWGMGLFGLAVLVVLVLAGAALVKYLFFDGRTRRSAENQGSTATGRSPDLPNLTGPRNGDGGSTQQSSKEPRS